MPSTTAVIDGWSALLWTTQISSGFASAAAATPEPETAQAMPSNPPVSQRPLWVMPALPVSLLSAPRTAPAGRRFLGDQRYHPPPEATRSRRGRRTHARIACAPWPVRQARRAAGSPALGG